MTKRPEIDTTLEDQALLKQAQARLRDGKVPIDISLDELETRALKELIDISERSAQKGYISLDDAFDEAPEQNKKT